MKIAICDDDSACLEQIHLLTTEYQEERKDKQLLFEQFSSPEDLIAVTRQGNYFDIYILDIVMPNKNGIKLGEILRNAGADGKIIYLTSSKDYALDSFRVRAFDYLIKPAQKLPFFQVLDDAINSVHRNKDKALVLKTKDGTSRITFDSILYAKLSKRIITYHLTNGKILESTTLRGTFADSVRELLLDQRFFLCSVSTVVNLHHITSVQNETVVFDNHEQIYFNQKLCRELRIQWNSYWTSEEV